MARRFQDVHPDCLSFAAPREILEKFRGDREFDTDFGLRVGRPWNLVAVAHAFANGTDVPFFVGRNVTVWLVQVVSLWSGSD